MLSASTDHRGTANPIHRRALVRSLVHRHRGTIEARQPGPHRPPRSVAPRSSKPTITSPSPSCACVRPNAIATSVPGDSYAADQRWDAWSTLTTSSVRARSLRAWGRSALGSSMTGGDVTRIFPTPIARLAFGYVWSWPDVEGMGSLDRPSLTPIVVEAWTLHEGGSPTQALNERTEPHSHPRRPPSTSPQTATGPITDPNPRKVVLPGVRGEEPPGAHGTTARRDGGGRPVARERAGPLLGGPARPGGLGGC